ncbi:MAG TPA: ankyrin repeat domain-containing protein [Candidatus Eisenbacteria bacterium]|nr:ankyrin repeat domain-containing protein [Candidatus Eisenbacteria bacterium]
MHRTEAAFAAAGALLLTLTVAGCDGARTTLDDIVRFAQRESQRRSDARSVRRDSILEASFAGNLPMVQGLLDADPPSAKERLRSRDGAGMTALHLATWGGHPEIVRLLLARGAEVNAKDGGGNSAVSLAARWGRSDIMDMLLVAGADASARDDQGRTLLHHAAQYGHIEVMRSLVAHGFDVDVQSRVGTPLHCAAAGRRLEAATFLLDHGARLDRRDLLGWSPLHVACSGPPGDPCNPELVVLLLDRRADLTSRAKSGITPLVLAAVSSDSAVAAILLARGARPDPAAPDGYSALRSAVEASNPAIARMLLERGADSNERYSPPRAERLLHRTVYHDSVDVARVLLEFGADVNVVDDNGLTPLHMAAREGNAELIRLLLAKGARIDARNKWNWTPLHFAASQKQLEAARALVERGADRSARTDGGETPFKMAWGPDGEPLRRLLGDPSPARR